jgi:hypothetical protein
MNWKLNSVVVFALLLLFALSFCKNKHDERDTASEHAQHGETAYACPIKCEGDKTYDKPGQCPVCKMNLEPVKDDLVQIISPNKQVLSRQATVKLQPGNSGKPLNAQGYIALDLTRNQSVAARFGGRIEKLYVKFSGQLVKQGDKVMDIYSPELRTVQEEHLFIIKSKTENSLIEKSQEKLHLLGITENQIAELEKTGTVAFAIAVYSPANGYVFFNVQSQPENTPPEQSTPAMNAMSMQSAVGDKSFTSSASQIRRFTKTSPQK